MSRGRRQRVAGLEQRDDPQHRPLAARLGEPALLHQQEHLEHVRRARGAGDHERLHGARVLAGEQRVQRAERRDGLLRRGRERAHVGGDQRPPVGDLARQQRRALVVAERGVGLVQPQRGQDLADRVAVDPGVLADVEPGEVEAEHLDLADQVAQVARRDEAPVRRLQRPLGHPQIVEQLLRALRRRPRRPHAWLAAARA